MSTVSFIVALSLLLQIVTVLYAIALVVITGWRKAWILLSFGIVTMAIRRFLALTQASSAQNLGYELVGLAGSVLMLAGVYYIKPIFLSLQRAEAELKESHERLFAFLDKLPVGVFIVTPDEKPFFMNKASTEMLGKGVVRDTGKQKLAETYRAFLAGSDEMYPAERLPVVRALRGETTKVSDMEIRRDPKPILVEVIGTPLCGPTGEIQYAIAVFSDITERKKLEDEKETLISSLKEALAQIKTLRGLLPICASCKKIRDDKGYWSQIEVYIQDHSEAEFSHSVCPDCLHTLYPELAARRKKS